MKGRSVVKNRNSDSMRGIVRVKRENQSYAFAVDGFQFCKVVWIGALDMRTPTVAAIKI